MRRLGFVLPIVLAAACGRTALLNRADRPEASSDARPDTPLAKPDLSLADEPLADAPRRDLPADQRYADLRDGPADSLRDLPPDRPPADMRPESAPRDLTADAPVRDLPGVELPWPDAATTDGKPVDATGPSTSCDALRALADQGVLTEQRTTEVIFAPDRSWVVLKTRQETPPGTRYRDQLLRVALPSGEIAVVSSAGGTAEAFGRRGGLLVLGANGDTGGVAVYEDGALRTLASGTCAHLAAPDGSRLYVIRDCTPGNRGTLDAIDVASGTATTLASNVLGQGYWTPEYAISPSGKYFAFLVQSPDGGETSSLLHVADSGGKVYALSSQRGAIIPWFASDELLLFSVGTQGYPVPSGSLRAHVPSSGDTSYSLAPAGQAAGLYGYKVSADRRWLLGIDDVRVDGGWVEFGLLYAIRLDGTGEGLLSSTLVPHWRWEMGFDSFAWSGDGSRAIYIAGRGNAVWASDLYGTAEVELSPGGWFRAASLGDQVAIIEDVGDARSNRLRVLAMGPMRVVFSFGTDGSLGAPNFTPDARGLLFVSTPSSGARQLRYFSASIADSVVLGEWTQTFLSRSPGSYAEPLGSYPMDPTGCFTVVDTDLAPGPGTRMVVLPD